MTTEPTEPHETRETPETVASPFAHGVASFDPLADRVLLWTHVARSAPGGAATIRWKVSDTLDGDPVREGDAVIDPDSGCVTVDATGLEPATTYHYWFELPAGPDDPLDGAPVLSPVGRTRTLPLDHCDWLRLAVVCCADRSMGELAAYRAIAEDEVDLVVHLGDYIYEEPKGPHEVDPPATCVTLSDYRRRHAHTRLDRDLQAMHLRHPMVFAWDDHDVADNAWRHGAKEHDPDEHGPWEERLAAAARARQEWLPARLVEPDNLLSMRRSFVIGDLAELVVLDTRIPGRDLQSGDEGAKSLEDPDRALLDPEQRRWAHERVLDTTRPWCLLASQVPVADLELPVPMGTLVDDAMPSGYRVIDGEAVCTDLWDGYPVERRALIDVIARRGAGTVVLSGDVHSAWASLLCTETGDAVAVDFVTSAVSATEMGQQLPPGWRKAAERIANEVPRQVWHDLERHGYLHVDVRPDRVRADWYAIESDERDAVPERLASWAVDHTAPGHLRRATPDSPSASFADVIRPGLPRETMPAPEAPPPRAPSSRIKILVGLAAVLGAAVAVLAWRRRRQ